MRGQVSAVTGGWRIGSVTFTTAQLAGVPVADWDQDGSTETAAAELAGVVDAELVATMTYLDPSGTVTAFTTS